MLLLALAPAPASAEVGALASVYNDYRIRGISFSDGRPVAIFDLSYDTTNGFYGAASGSIVATRHEGLKPLGFILNAGYAKRIRSALTADLGVVHSHYSHYSGVSSGRSYTEGYAGLSGKFVGARIAASPDYVGTARWTLHGEVNGHVDLTSRLNADASVGVLAPIDPARYNGNSSLGWDARLALTEHLGPISLQGAVTSHGGRAYHYAWDRHANTALVLGISAAF